MPDASDITDTIAQTGSDGIASSSVGPSQQTTTVLSIDEQIKAANYVASQAAASSGGAKFGLRFSKLVPPGCG